MTQGPRPRTPNDADIASAWTQSLGWLQYDVSECKKVALLKDHARRSVRRGVGESTVNRGVVRGGTEDWSERVKRRSLVLTFFPSVPASGVTIAETFGTQLNKLK